MKLSRICKDNWAGIGSDELPESGRELRYYRLYSGNIFAIFFLPTAATWAIYGINYFTYMPPDPNKIQALQASGTLNPHPEKVRHPRFADAQFFDPHDLLQVKYETLRAVQTDGQPITQAAADFGLSRPTIYQARHSFQAAGLEGLFPRKRGPKSPHKLTPEVRQYLEQCLAAEPDLKTVELLRQVRQRFGVQVHSRTLEKALPKAKRGRPTPPQNHP
jgi:transposase